MKKFRMSGWLMIAGIPLAIAAGCNGAGTKESSSRDNVSTTDTTGKDSLYSGTLFNEHIRRTTARTPEDERLGFKLPEGFEISLFASEPDIGKPINVAFDAKGRMWVTQSFEYPFPATPGKGKDRLTILEDTDNDGKADKFTHFEDTLNIPIGVLPVNDGVIAYSIPNVYKFTDANGDGEVDGQSKVIGPFEHKDTHGMVNNFISGYDGWVHACHGYTNRSNVAGADGDSIHMISGNTFRFRRDGSRVEHETVGRINPFGLAYDEKGYLYSTDCHTSPLYQLIRGGDYTQWGKEEEMGFAPDMKPLENEATALAGLAYYADSKFPADYQSNFFIGDAVSSRVYRNSFAFKGSSPTGKKEEDFILSKDPWFRPVDVKLGPDGALYIADFYNSIIGHYEVPLDHPLRDRVRGRIWRITYKGKTNKPNDWTTATTDRLIEALNADNLAVRMTAADQLAERIGKPAATPALALINKKDVSAREYIHALWVLQRLGALPAELVQRSAASQDPLVRVHTMRILLEEKDESRAMYPIALKGLQDADPHVRRAATELMGKYADTGTIKTLIDLRKKTPDFDSHLIYTTRLVLRNILRTGSMMHQVATMPWQNEDAAVLATVMPGVKVPESGVFLFNYVKNQTPPREELPKAFMHIVRFIPAGQINAVTAVARQQSATDIGTEYQTFRALQQGLERKGLKENTAMQQWGKDLSAKLVNKHKASDLLAISNPDSLGKAIDQTAFGFDLAGNYKLSKLEPQLQAALKDSAEALTGVRSAALRALLKINMQKNAPIARAIFENENAPNGFKRRIVEIVGEFSGPAVNNFMAKLKNVPPDLQQTIVMSLAGSSAGKKIIFDKVRKGEILARTLIQPKIEERIMINITGKEKETFQALTANLESIDKERQNLIYARITSFNHQQDNALPATGRTVFVRNCATCHSIGGEGGSIGPQLDGVGKWGVTSLAEKILDPNRNISENFRNYTVKLKDGKVLSGLHRRDEGEVSVFADNSGKEFTVSKKEIAERTASKFTLMPDQFGTILSEADFNSLIAYLLTVKNSE